MRTLVTGGAGFIGSHIADLFVAEGHEVCVIDDLSSGKLDNLNPAVRFEQCDVREPKAADVLRSFKPEVLIHHAAQMSVTHSVADPRFDADVNVLGFINLLEAGRESGISKVIFASSGGTVYGESEQIPFHESVPTHPVCPYGISKLAGEHYLFYYRRLYGIPYVALRYANVYGPRQDPHGEAGVVAIFSQRLLRGEDCTIFGDGKQTRDYVFVADVARANLIAAGTDFVGPVNIGTGDESDVNTLYEVIKGHAGGSGKAVHGDPRDGELQRSALDNSLAGDVLGWRPEVSLSEGLAQTVDFFRSRS